MPELRKDGLLQIILMMMVVVVVVMDVKEEVGVLAVMLH
jgi:hypothetical protein